MDLEIQRDRVLMAYKKQFLLLYIDLLKTKGLKFVRITEKLFQMNVKMNQILMKNRIRNFVLEVFSTMIQVQNTVLGIFHIFSQ